MAEAKENLEDTQASLTADEEFLMMPTFKQSCAIQSGEIFGIFKQIKESFDTNLSDSQKEEH